MASTKVIATTWAKKDLLKKLNETLKRMDDEIEVWEKQNSTLETRQQAWDKKAVAWAKKNMAKAYEVDTNMYHNRFQLSYSFNSQLAQTVLGERPSNERKPDYKDGRYNNGDTTEYSQVLNAISLIEGGIDTEFKITTSCTWASFIR